jgi:hypothetical protein
MKVVHTAPDVARAHLVAGFLQSRGIQAIVGNEMASAARGEVPLDLSTSPNVLVADADVARAKQLLGEDLPGGACRR